MDDTEDEVNENAEDTVNENPIEDSNRDDDALEDQAEATHNVEDDFDFSNADMQAGYYDSNGNYLGDDLDAAREAQEDWRNNGDSDYEVWGLDNQGEEFSDSFGYDVNEDGSAKINLHNAKTKANDISHAVRGWVENKADQINRALGGTRAGYTSADFERQQEAEKAWNEYNKKAEEQKSIIAAAEQKMKEGPLSADSQRRYEEALKAYDDLISRRDGISRDINSTDTGSRIKNAGNNLLEDLGDIGTRVNQFFGGSDEYGLGARGQINDRNGDNRTSVLERLQNMSRDVRDWGVNKLKSGGSGFLGGLVGGTLGVVNPLLGYAAGQFTKAGIEKGISKLQDYARDHYNHNFLTQEQVDRINRENALALANDSGSSEDNPTYANLMEAARTSEPIARAAANDLNPEATRHNWSEKKLEASSNNRSSLGGWTSVNDVMGEKTKALSDAHFKDFMLCMFTEDPAVHNVVRTKLMMDYFDPRQNRRVR